MKVLLSAFACEPKQGSEFAVGWNWAVYLAQVGHQVVVLTRAQSRSAIERAMTESLANSGLRFEYFDVPQGLRWQARGPLHLHYALWQRLAAEFAIKLHRRERFDRVHHVTYAGLRAPSFMGRLGIPFILGPVGGGERAPWRLRRGYTLHGWAHDAARDLANLMVRFTPFMSGTFASAEHIYITSRDTLHLVPRRFRDKATIELAIGNDEAPLLEVESQPLPRHAGSRFRVLYAGRFVDYKGMHIGLRAFARLVEAEPNARLTMVGDGPARGHWRRLARRLGVAAKIDWLPWQKREAMGSLYARHHVFLFPSMHDSGGMVVLEAMNYGVPVVCLKLGGPATLVDARSGFAIDPAKKGVAQVAREMGDALIGLTRDTVRLPLSRAALQRSSDFSWPEKVARIHGMVTRPGAVLPASKGQYVATAVAD